MHDGVPPHFLLAFREFLNNLFPEQRVRRSGPTAWSALSPDLNPLHFHLWWRLKSTVCATAAGDVMYLQQRTKWVWGDSQDSWNFSAIQAVAVQTCNILHRVSKLALSAFSLSSGGRNTKTKLQKSYVHSFLCCGVDSFPVDLAICFPLPYIHNR